MELKSYDKPWLPAIKGVFLILFGIAALLQIIGSVKVLSILFIVLISATGILLIASGILFEKSKSRSWPIFFGALNIGFSIYLLIKLDSPLADILWILFALLVLYVIFQFIEAGILFYQKNAFCVLFVINALLSVLFAYFFYIVLGNFTPQSLFYIGIIALITGIINVLSSYLLSRLK